MGGRSNNWRIGHVPTPPINPPNKHDVSFYIAGNSYKNKRPILWRGFNRLPISHICPVFFKLSNTSFAKFFESELCCAFDISLNAVIIYSISRHATNLSKQS